MNVIFFNLLSQYYSFMLSDIKKVDSLVIVGAPNLGMGYALRPLIGNPYLGNICGCDGHEPQTEHVFMENLIAKLHNNLDVEIRKSDNASTVVVFVHFLTQDMETAMNRLFGQCGVERVVYLTVYKVGDYSSNYRHTKADGTITTLNITRHALDTTKI